MSTGVRMLASFGLGAAFMYLVDPRLGRRRRAVMRDGLTHAVTVERRVMGKAKRDLGHRVHGVVEQIRHPTTADVSDEVLVDRVRAVVGRATSHPSSIEVSVVDHEAVLAGPVLEAEAPSLLALIAEVPGVARVNDRLEHHRTAETIPGLQGAARPRSELVAEMWRPGPRLVLGSLGAVGLAAAFRWHGPLGALAKGLGCAVVARAIANHPLPTLVGIKPIEIDIEKTITIHAPRTLVFALWTRIHEFPRFLDHVRSVRVVAGDAQRSRWLVDGPLGLRSYFEARTTRVEQDRLVAWTTTPESPLQHTGTVHFEDVDGGTRVHVQLRYRPPGGLLGHTFARLFGFDPRSRMNDDLVRAKALLEEGRTSAHHQRVNLHEIAVS